MPTVRAIPFQLLPEDFRPKNGRNKLTANQVNEIRRMRYWKNKSLKEIALTYGVCITSISNICSTYKNGSWKR